MQSLSTMFKLVEPSFPPKGKLYHVTPTANVPTILEKGLVRGIARSTSGVETQKKIYLTSQLWGADDIFPNMFGWKYKDLSVLEVDTRGLKPKAEADPEYDNDMFFMIDCDIPANRVKLMGKAHFVEKDGKFYGNIVNDSSAKLIEHVKKSGDEWVVTNKAGDKILGKHPSKKEANAQLAAIEISKAQNESDEPLPKYKGAKKVGVFSNGVVVGYGYRMKDGSIDIDGLCFKDEDEARRYRYDIEDLPPGYEKMQGRHFHERR